MSNNCDCGHDHDDYAESITLTLDDGSEVVCEVLGTFDLNGTDYIVLMPEGDEEVLIYRYKEDDGENIQLEAIDSDEEFAAVSEAFDELFTDDFDEEDFDDDDEEDFDDEGDE